MAMTETTLSAVAPLGELIPPGRWTIDPDHSTVGFVVRHLGITKLRGRFSDVAGAFAAIGDGVTGNATVVANSLETGNDARDKHVKGPDFLGAETHPHIILTITGVRPNSGDYIVDGTLELHGTTHDVVFHAVSGGTAKDPYGHDRVGIELTTRILRSEYGITFDPTGALVSDAVDLEIDLSLVRQPEYLRNAERRHQGIAS
jgi:polyisoprenoid-binding protein YceI